MQSRTGLSVQDPPTAGSAGGQPPTPPYPPVPPVLPPDPPRPPVVAPLPPVPALPSLDPPVPPAPEPPPPLVAPLAPPVPALVPPAPPTPPVAPIAPLPADPPLPPRPPPAVPAVVPPDPTPPAFPAAPPLPAELSPPATPALPPLAPIAPPPLAPPSSVSTFSKSGNRHALSAHARNPIATQRSPERMTQNSPATRLRAAYSGRRAASGEPLGGLVRSSTPRVVIPMPTTKPIVEIVTEAPRGTPASLTSRISRPSALAALPDTRPKPALAILVRRLPKLRHKQASCVGRELQRPHPLRHPATERVAGDQGAVLAVDPAHHDVHVRVVGEPFSVGTKSASVEVCDLRGCDANGLPIRKRHDVERRGRTRMAAASVFLFVVNEKSQLVARASGSV
jgi:hypothetical protein